MGPRPLGYRTLRVAGRMTFWLSGAGKSVFSWSCLPRSWGYRTLRVAGGWRSAPLAFRTASFARRVGSKLGQALPQHLWPTPNQHVSSYSPRPLAPILSKLARNSPAAPSNIEFASLELQRFPAVSKNYRLKLCATFVWARPAIARRHRGQALQQHLGLTPATRNVL